ncbi:serine hydrolase domain-containing protein [Larkinella sp. GY13]|uniref:serine hydrolase domain-containing protein n=1 Tax=Larkinella sp. GY13 TaxID=3453720 RepID=UPI003EEF4489
MHHFREKRTSSFITRSIAWIFSLAFLSACDPGNESLSPARDYATFLQGLLDKAVAEDPMVHNAVLRVESPTLSLHWKGASGLANPATGQKMKPNHAFRSASIGKTTLAALVLKLTEEGKVALNDPIGNYLPENILTGIHVLNGVSYQHQITVRQLLNHISGIGDYIEEFISEEDKTDGLPYLMELVLAKPDKRWTPLETIQFYKQYLKPHFKPGEGWFYSDTNYQLLGLLVEKVTEMPLNQAYKKWLFDPLKMDNTYQEFYDQPRGESVADGVSHSFFLTFDITDFKSVSVDWAGGGLVTTTDDLRKFMRALIGNTYFSKSASKNEMFSWVPVSGQVGYGLGISKIRLAGEELIGHEGFYGSSLYYWPARDAVIVSTINQGVPEKSAEEAILIPLLNELKKP